MPCSDYSDADTIHELSGQIKALTRVACELAEHLPYSVRTSLSAETRAWLEKHAEEDRRRRELESKASELLRKRKEALKKLTLEERRILGVTKFARQTWF